MKDTLVGEEKKREEVSLQGWNKWTTTPLTECNAHTWGLSNKSSTVSIQWIVRLQNTDVAPGLCYMLVPVSRLFQPKTKSFFVAPSLQFKYSGLARHWTNSSSCSKRIFSFSWGPVIIVAILIDILFVKIQFLLLLFSKYLGSLSTQVHLKLAFPRNAHSLRSRAVGTSAFQRLNSKKKQLKEDKYREDRVEWITCIYIYIVYVLWSSPPSCLGSPKDWIEENWFF